VRGTLASRFVIRGREMGMVPSGFSRSSSTSLPHDSVSFLSGMKILRAIDDSKFCEAAIKAVIAQAHASLEA
jgi:hypothetical protein